MLTVAELNQKYFPRDLERTEISSGLLIVTEIGDDLLWRTRTLADNGVEKVLAAAVGRDEARLNHAIWVQEFRSRK